jgi:hypothetical protein
MQGSDGKFYPITLENSTGTTKTISTQTMLIGGAIVYYSSTTALTTDQTSTAFYQAIPTTQMRYTFNQNGGYSAYQPIYLVGSLDANGYFVLDNSSYTSFYTQTLPSSDDGKLYIYIGVVYGTNSLQFNDHHHIYEYKDGKVRLYAPTQDIAENLTLTGTDISNKYKDLAHIPQTNTAVGVFPVGGVKQLYGTDFTVITDGTDVRRLNWDGLGLESLLAEGDIISVDYIC